MKIHKLIMIGLACLICSETIAQDSWYDLFDKNGSELKPKTPVQVSPKQTSSHLGGIKKFEHVYFDQTFELHMYDKFGHIDPTSTTTVYLSVSSDTKLSQGTSGKLRVLLQTQDSQHWDMNKSMCISQGRIAIQYTDDSVSIPRFPSQFGYTVKPGNQGIHKLYDTTPHWKQAVSMLELGMFTLLDTATKGIVGKAKTISDLADEVEKLKHPIPTEAELLRMNDRYDHLALTGWNVYDSATAMRDTDFTERAYDIPFAINASEDWEIDLSIQLGATPIVGNGKNYIRKDQLPVVIHLDRNSTSVTKLGCSPKTLGLGGGITMNFVCIPAGEFMMGSPLDEVRRHADETQHRVRISKPFLMQTTEVTQGQWQAMMGNNPSKFKGNANLPVERISWHDAVSFCKKLSKRFGGNYRLPTEAEWEYACRAGTSSRFSFGEGDSSLCHYGNYWDISNTSNASWQDKSHNDGHDKTAHVGSYRPNAWGLYDMHGNVWEWCSDWYGNYPSGQVTDPTGASSGKGRVCRGGSWDEVPWFCRSADRGRYYPTGAGSNLGFRVVCSVVSGPGPSD